jgi:hypothetical protein
VTLTFQSLEPLLTALLLLFSEALTEPSWVDVDTFTKNGEFVGYEPEPNMRYRAGCKTGEYGATSSIVLRIGGEWRATVS